MNEYTELNYDQLVNISGGGGNDSVSYAIGHAIGSAVRYVNQHIPSDGGGIKSDYGTWYNH